MLNGYCVVEKQVLNVFVQVHADQDRESGNLVGLPRQWNSILQVSKLNILLQHEAWLCDFFFRIIRALQRGFIIQLTIVEIIMLIPVNLVNPKEIL